MNRRLWRKFLFFLLIAGCLTTAQAAELQVFFLNVGEGEATYIETADKRNILIDAGNLITGYKVVKFLEKRGIKKLDYLIVTHPHPDHMGGVFHVLQHLEVKKRYDNDQSWQSKGTVGNILRWYSEIFRRENYEPLKAGDKINLKDLTLEVLSPARLSKDWNSNSLVLKLVYGKTAFLFMSDANIMVEKELLKKGASLKADVLKIGHHGARDATSEEFFTAVSPKFSIISTDHGVIRERDYLNPTVISRITSGGSKLFLTYRDGDILLKSDRNVVTKVTR